MLIVYIYIHLYENGGTASSRAPQVDAPADMISSQTASVYIYIYI